MRGTPLHFVLLFLLMWGGLLLVLWPVAGASGNNTTDVSGNPSGPESSGRPAWLNVTFTESPNAVGLRSADGDMLWEADAPDLEESIFLESVAVDARGLVFDIRCDWSESRRRATSLSLQMVDSGERYAVLLWTDGADVDKRVLLK
jgi:hypothetical protein